MIQGYIGYDLQNSLREELLDRGHPKGCSHRADPGGGGPQDPAFQHPTKPIGAFMSQEEAERMVAERGYDVLEDAGRGWRRVVASPKPVSVVELDTIQALVDSDHVVIACGGAASRCSPPKGTI